MTHLFIEPTDVLVFRDGRPFDAGADHLATGPFPPLPFTVYGALRSALLAHHGADFHLKDHEDKDREDFGLSSEAAAVLGSKTTLGTLTLAGLALARRNGATIERLYPPPRDLLTKKDEAAEGLPHVLIRPFDGNLEGATTDLDAETLPDGLRLLAPPPHPVGTFYEAAGSVLLTETGFARVLAGKPPEKEHLVDVETVYQREPRTSVSLRGTDPFTGTAQEGKLFTVDFVRMAHDAGFAVAVESGIPLPERGLLRLGGESRPARFETTGAPALDVTAARDGARDSGQVKLVLATPAPFAEGWLPDGIGKDGTGTLKGVAVRLVGAAVGRQQTVGGWDIARNHPKPTRRAAPVGSVYFLELDLADAASLFDALHGRSLFPADSPDARQGLGLVHLGTW